MNRDIVVLPPGSTEWIINQPDEVLSVKEVHFEELQVDHTFSDPAITRMPYHEHVIKTDLLRHLGHLTMDIMDELKTGFDETWGLDTKEWTSIGVFDNMMTIIARTSNRIFVGLPHSVEEASDRVSAGRNESFLSLAQKFSQEVVFGSFIIRQLPRAFRSIVAPIVTLPNQYHSRKMRQLLEPEIQSRLSNLDPRKDGTQSGFNDFLQWSIDNARTRLSDKPQELTSHMLAGRISAVNFAAIHTSTISITNALFDLVSSDPSLHYLEQLREEATSVLAEDDGIWTKIGLSKMYKIDSALRESLRLRSFVSVGMVRKVVAKDGVTTPEGMHIPFGAHVGVAAMGIHNEESIYTSPGVYDAVRFVNQKDNIDAAEQRRDNDYLKKANLAMVSTSTTYQPFGHGRHACPGRFFAATELKLLLAYMVLNYEIEPLTERPSGKWISNVILPPMQATIRVRRRKTDEMR